MHQLWRNRKRQNPIYFIELIWIKIFDFNWANWCRKSLNKAINKKKPIIMPILVKSTIFLFWTRPVVIFEWSDKFGLILFPNGFDNAIGSRGGFFSGGNIVILNPFSVCRSLTFIGLCVFLWFQNSNHELNNNLWKDKAKPMLLTDVAGEIYSS